MQTEIAPAVQPKVSVITVCLNAARTIERTIRSVLDQTYSNLEYHIIDGGSTDATLDIVDRYSDLLASVTSEPDNGIYDGMNKGIRRANGEWIHLLNADDRYVDETALARAVERLDPGKTNYCWMYLETSGEQWTPYVFRFSRHYLCLSAKLPHPAMIVSRSQYAEVGLYDTRYRIASDHDFILRMLKRYPPIFIDLPLVVMQQEGISAKNLKLTYQEFRDVTIRHDLPRWLAYGIYWLKRLRFNV